MKRCSLCTNQVKDRSYRSLTSETSQEQYKYIFEMLPGIMRGVSCNVCANKLNRICKINNDIKTKVEVLRDEREKLIQQVRELPGLTPKRGTPRGMKRPLIKTPTPKGKCKKVLFSSSSTFLASSRALECTNTRTYDKSTQTASPADFRVKV